MILHRHTGPCSVSGGHIQFVIYTVCHIHSLSYTQFVTYTVCLLKNGCLQKVGQTGKRRGKEKSSESGLKREELVSGLIFLKSGLKSQ